MVKPEWELVQLLSSVSEDFRGRSTTGQSHFLIERASSEIKKAVEEMDKSTVRFAYEPTSVGSRGVGAAVHIAAAGQALLAAAMLYGDPIWFDAVKTSGREELINGAS